MSEPGASGLRLPSFFQSAMVMFDLAWMMSKDMNDMLWYVASSSSSVRPVRAGSRGRCHHCTALVPTGSTGCRPLPGNVHGPGFLSNCELSGVEGAWPVRRVGWWGLCAAPAFLLHAEPYGRGVRFEQGSPARHLDNPGMWPL